MKLFKISLIILLSTTFCMSVAAQSKTETFKVSGNCGMCKSNIEKAAKVAGAENASWNKETKELTVKYSSSITNAAKIQQKIAEIGYDNAGFKTTDEAYNKLAPCCKYERETVAAGEEKSMACSKEGHDGKECCKKEGEKMTCSKEGHDGKDCCKKEGEKMNCCKEGKCTREGHEGKDCCKKEGEKMDCAKEGNEGKSCCSKEGTKGDKQ